jgi:hypothetical protein
MSRALLLSILAIVAAHVYDPRGKTFLPTQEKGAWVAATGAAALDSPAARATFARLKSLGYGSVAFGPVVEMPDFKKPELRFGSGDAALRRAIRAAREEGLGVFLLPRIESPAFFEPTGRPDVNPPWRGDLDMETEAKWDAFFAEYRRMIANYGRIAEEEGVSWLAIGLEYRKSAVAHPDRWRSVAAEARRVFKGKLTYSANWDDFDRVTWWDAVDAIGIGAYFELAPTPRRLSEEEAREGWRPIKDRLAAYASRQERPILFTETGYTAFEDCAAVPWKWQHVDRPIDPAAQADAWRALLKTFAGERWWSGVYVWTYYAEPTAAAAWDYSPEAREAERVLSAAFKR